MTDTQAIDVVTFDFKGTRVRCFVSGSTDYKMNFFLVLLFLVVLLLYVPSQQLWSWRGGQFT